MITHYAGGGLGNQLFNYAAARSLADRHGTSLVIDASSYRDQWRPDATRPFLLGAFPIRARLRDAGPEPERRSLPARIWRRVREDAFVTRVVRGGRELSYFESFSALGPRVALYGHFIDPRFFAGNAARIRNDLALDDRVVPDGRLRTELARIRQTPDSVSVHVRRGDLLAPANSWLLLPGIESYYRLAMSAMLESMPQAHFFVFSDDPDWCRDNFAAHANRLTIVSSGKNSDALAEFRLMTQCRHHIIANSAFSWWSAWLRRDPDGKVLAPYRWEQEGVLDMEHFLPANWEQIRW